MELKINKVLLFFQVLTEQKLDQNDVVGNTGSNKLNVNLSKTVQKIKIITASMHGVNRFTYTPVIKQDGSGKHTASVCV